MYVTDIRRHGPGVRGSPLGNPFVLADASNDEAREAVCDAYRDLLDLAVLGGAPRSHAALVEFGRARGHTGRVCAWDGRAAAREVARLAHVVTVRDVQLKGQCAPRRCHGHEIAARVLFEQMWARTVPRREPSPWL